MNTTQLQTSSELQTITLITDALQSPVCVNIIEYIFRGLELLTQ